MTGIPVKLDTACKAALGTFLKLSITLGSIPAASISAKTSAWIPSLSATFINLTFLSGALISAVSSAATPLASVTSSSNCSFNILLADSIALDGRYLFI